jgi:glycosyltransferase involved in cell wall biosynthesis
VGYGTFHHIVKIAFVEDAIFGYASGASVVGGAERQQWLLARALAAAGWSVIVGMHGTLAIGERSTIEGVEFLGLGHAHIGLGRDHIHRVWYRFLASQRPDWWYWRCANHLLGSAVEIAKLAHVRTIFAAGFDTDVQPRRALVRRPHWWPLYAWGLERSDRILVQHGGQLAALPKRWGPKAHLVPSIARLAPTVKPHSDRTPYVAWVAMLRQPKRPDALIEIARRAPTIRFVVCGGSTDFASPAGYGDRIIKALRSQHNVQFLGQVAPQTASQIIADAAMLISTSDQEGFPNTFLEAWAAGTPVISLKVDPDHVIERHRLGAIAGDIEGAVAHIAALMESPARRDEIADRSRQYVVKAHSEAGVAALFARIVGTERREDYSAGTSQQCKEQHE